jgi:predicted amino acid dehydrogenase
MLVDQSRAVARMERMIRVCDDHRGYRAVGLGSQCAVVGGRGTALADRVSVPVTTGGAATAWALWRNVSAVADARGITGPIAVVGSSGPVGRVVAGLLAEEGRHVRVDSRRGGRGASVEVCRTIEDTVADAALVVGAGPTGSTLDPSLVRPDVLMVDVAIPATFAGPPPESAEVYAGEAVGVPTALRRGLWGGLYQVLAGYGPWQLYACVIEPLVMVAQGRTEPYAMGRKLDPETVRAFGAAATELGFRARLARGMFEVHPAGGRWTRARARLPFQLPGSDATG